MKEQPSTSPSVSQERRGSPRRHEDKRLLQRERELEAARRISQALSQHIHVDDLVRQSLGTALEVVGAEAGSVLLADPEGKELVFQYSVGEAPVPRGTAIPSNQGIAGVVFQSGEPAVIGDVTQDIRHFTGIDTRTGFKTRDMITVPLKRWEGRPIGVLNVLNKRTGHLDKDDLSILTIISALTAVSIEQARLFEEAKLAEVAHRVGDIGHDVKNMLTPVVSGAEILEDEVELCFTKLPAAVAASKEMQESQGRCVEVFEMVRDSARRIQDRVREIADCVKNLSSPLQLGPCRVEVVVDSVVKTLRVLAREKNIALHTEGLDDLPPIRADERRLYNAFYNLINNAIPEVPSGGSITVRGKAEPKSDHITVWVADTGRGMPPEVRKSLFTPRAVSRKQGGTGLGTKIVKDAVDAHGGQITVESQEGVGTTFQIRLPVRPPGSSK
jgi:signal transduction histidine kinase